jgi:hypothetical protein
VQFGAYQPRELDALCNSKPTVEEREKCKRKKEDENYNACAMYDTGRQVIWYKRTDDWSKWYEKDERAVVRTLSHEFGHILNLDHKFDDETVMREGVEKDCLWIATNLLKDIQEADVLDAIECADPSKFRTQQ